MNGECCRFCGTELKHTFADLGLSPISNEYLEVSQIQHGQHFYPLHVKVCEKCKLVQVGEYRKPQDIFKDYKYLSSFSLSWLKHCSDYVDMITARLNLDSDSLVYEIACNDGYLLQYFLPKNIPVWGVEPAENVAEEAKKKGIDVEVEFWGADTAKEISLRHGKADLIIGNNVLAHVPDINSFVKGLEIALSEKGTITMEFPHLLKLMKYNQFDTIYHEHFSYLSLMAVNKIFGFNGLKIYDVEELSTHGGSLRIYATHKENNDYEINKEVDRVLSEEKEYGMESIETYEKFDKQIQKIKFDSCKKLIELKNDGKKIVGFGAAAKGNTFLNYCGIGKEYIDFVVDSNIEKQGLYLPGTLIPIKSPEVIKEEKPDYIIFLPWNLKNELIEVLSYTREWGCKFITFIPEVEVF